MISDNNDSNNNRLNVVDEQQLQQESLTRAASFELLRKTQHQHDAPHPQLQNLWKNTSTPSFVQQPHTSSIGGSSSTSVISKPKNLRVMADPNLSRIFCSGWSSSSSCSSSTSFPSLANQIAPAVMPCRDICENRRVVLPPPPARQPQRQEEEEAMLLPFYPQSQLENKKDTEVCSSSFASTSSVRFGVSAEDPTPPPPEGDFQQHTRPLHRVSGEQHSHSYQLHQQQQQQTVFLSANLPHSSSGGGDTVLANIGSTAHGSNGGVASGRSTPGTQPVSVQATPASNSTCQQQQQALLLQREASGTHFDEATLNDLPTHNIMAPPTSPLRAELEEASAKLCKIEVTPELLIACLRPENLSYLSPEQRDYENAFIRYELNPQCCCLFTNSEPPIAFKAYLTRLMQYCRASSFCYLLAMMYVLRLEKFGLLVTPRSIHRLYIACLTLAIKQNDDHFLSQDFYSQCGGVPKAELNNMERQVFALLGFDCYVSPVEALQVATVANSHLELENNKRRREREEERYRLSISEQQTATSFVGLLRMSGETIPHHSPQPSSISGGRPSLVSVFEAPPLPTGVSVPTGAARGDTPTVAAGQLTQEQEPNTTTNTTLRMAIAP